MAALPPKAATNHKVETVKPAAKPELPASSDSDPGTEEEQAKLERAMLARARADGAKAYNDETVSAMTERVQKRVRY